MIRTVQNFQTAFQTHVGYYYCINVFILEDELYKLGSLLCMPIKIFLCFKGVLKTRVLQFFISYFFYWLVFMLLKSFGINLEKLVLTHSTNIFYNAVLKCVCSQVWNCREVLAYCPQFNDIFFGTDACHCNWNLYSEEALHSVNFNISTSSPHTSL